MTFGHGHFRVLDIYIFKSWQVKQINIVWGQIVSKLGILVNKQSNFLQINKSPVSSFLFFFYKQNDWNAKINEGRKPATMQPKQQQKTTKTAAPY